MHLLATQSATLDEIDAAVDLGQTAGDIVVLSFSDSDLSALAAAWRNAKQTLPSLRLASLKRLRHPMSVDLYVDDVVSKSRLVIVRSLGGLDYWRYGFEQVAEACRRSGAKLVALPGDDRPDPRLSGAIHRVAGACLPVRRILSRGRRRQHRQCAAAGGGAGARRDLRSTRTRAARAGDPHVRRWKCDRRSAMDRGGPGFARRCIGHLLSHPACSPTTSRRCAHSCCNSRRRD